MTLEELQAEAHTHCPPTHPMGANHDASVHGAAVFYLPLADEGYTAKQIIDAVIAVAGDPMTGEWTQHPRPDVVLDWLRGHVSD